MFIINNTLCLCYYYIIIILFLNNYFLFIKCWNELLFPLRDLVPILSYLLFDVLIKSVFNLMDTIFNIILWTNKKMFTLTFINFPTILLEERG